MTRLRKPLAQNLITRPAERFDGPGVPVHDDSCGIHTNKCIPGSFEYLTVSLFTARQFQGLRREATIHDGGQHGEAPEP
jgi:hypothetical protein